MDTNEINSQIERPPVSNKSSSTLMDAFDLVVKAFIFGLIILTFLFKTCTVIGGSMNTTLNNGDKIIISNIFYSPKENDIIVFHETENLNEPVVKRVIATGNKWVKIDFDKCILYVSNDDIFDESDMVDESEYAYFDTGKYNMTGTLEIYVPDGFLFVMGDNRNNSTDSRSDKIGLVDERSVLGKVLFRFYPFDDFTFLN